MGFSISIDGSDRVFNCATGQAVLSAMSAAGSRELQVGCRSGGCGVCRVQVLSGRFHTGLMSRSQIDSTKEKEGFVLACKLYPDSDLQLRAIGRLSAAISTQAPATRSAGTRVRCA